MRYEHIVLDLSTAACAALLEHLSECYFPIEKYGQHADNELQNLISELEARLQRRDQDPHAKVPEFEVHVDQPQAIFDPPYDGSDLT